jgi:protease II
MQRATVFRRQISTLRSLAAVLKGRSSAIPHAQPIPLKPLPVYHGKHRQDTYHWLQNAADPAVEKYLHDEQRYVDAYMADTVKFQVCRVSLPAMGHVLMVYISSSVDTLQHELYEDMARHVEREEESVPEIVDAYMYYTRTGHGESLPIYYRQPVDPSGMVESRRAGPTSSLTSLNLG